MVAGYPGGAPVRDEHFGELVVKSRGGYGGKEVMIGPEETKESMRGSAGLSRATRSSISLRRWSTFRPTSSAGPTSREVVQPRGFLRRLPDARARSRP
jgi:hypothetical protein